MSPRRRAVALGGLALALGALAAADVTGREAALRREVGPLVPVLLARVDIAGGARIAADDLAVRRVPARYAPREAFAAAAQAAGARAAVAIAAGTDLQAALLRAPETGTAGALAGARPAERLVRIVAVGAAEELPPGTAADVLITRDAPDGGARTAVALRAAEVVAAAPAPALAEGESAGLPRVALALRVGERQAVALVEAQNTARELRVLARPGSSGR